jgi:acetyl-CoA C-acetyltransferase
MAEGKGDIVIVSAVRTPFSRFDIAMADIPSIDLGVMVMKEVIGRVGVKPEEVDEIYYGSCIPAEVALEMDVPPDKPPCWPGFPTSASRLPWIAPAARR